MDRRVQPSVGDLVLRIEYLEAQLGAGQPRAPQSEHRRSARPSRGLLAWLAAIALVVSVPVAVLANHQFSDVPDTNVFHDDIDAIASVGVTTGCGGGKYCPSDIVTREQMAAFMNRLGALAAGKIPVVNATKLDGKDSTEFLGATSKAADSDLLDGVDATAFSRVVASGSAAIDLGAIASLGCQMTTLGTSSTHGTQVLVNNPYDDASSGVATLFIVTGARTPNGAGDDVYLKVCNLGLLANPAAASFSWALLQ